VYTGFPAKKAGRIANFLDSKIQLFKEELLLELWQKWYKRNVLENRYQNQLFVTGTLA
jgi:hypothetical protein